MPGSFRVLNHVLKPLPSEKVKSADLQSQQEDSSIIEEKGEGPDGKWGEQQNFRFTIFVNYYQNVFTSKHKRKVCKIFKIFSQFLQPRTPTQCRSHFQKMMAKHKSITKLKKYYKTLFGESTYRKELNQFRRSWQLSHQPLEVLYPEIKESREVAIQTETQEQVVPVCSNCRVREQTISISTGPSTQNFQQILYWGDMSQLQHIMGGPYMMWIPTQSQESPL